MMSTQTYLKILHIDHMRYKSVVVWVASKTFMKLSSGKLVSAMISSHKKDLDDLHKLIHKSSTTRKKMLSSTVEACKNIKLCNKCSNASNQRVKTIFKDLKSTYAIAMEEINKRQRLLEAQETMLSNLANSMLQEFVISLPEHLT